MIRALTALLVAFVISAPWQAHASTGTCPRPASGSVVSSPKDLFSQNGTLSVTLDYFTTMDSASRTLFCFMTPDGAQGPTLHVNPGDNLDITVRNQVPALPPGTPTETISSAEDVCGDPRMTDASMNVHFHGMNVSPTCGGDEVIHTLINPGQTFHYHLTIPSDEPAGLYWYHPHVHGIAEPAVQGGASGVIVVQGIERVQPSLAGLPERILVIRDQTVAGNPSPGGDIPAWDLSINYVPIASPALVPAVIATNGKDTHEFWRVANASADTILDLEVAFDGVAQPLAVVALDGVPTGSQDGTRRGTSVQKAHILLPPGGRAEFIAPMPTSGTVQAVLRTRKINTGPLGDNDTARVLATIRRGVAGMPTLASMPQPSSALPGRQRFEGLDQHAPTATRKLYFSEVVSDPNDPASPTNFYITVDGATPKLFDPINPPSITTRAGSVEDWTIENRAGEAHEFHIHQIHFKILSRDGIPVPPPQRQFRDTVNIPFWSGKGPYPSVTVRMDFRGMVVGDYVYHCHILGHEDNGMMAIIRVLPSL